jgi:DNA mismatch repair protein MutS
LRFRSILFDESAINSATGGREEPEFFTDLNLDQIIASVTAGRDEYNLKPFFYTALSDTGSVHYRQDILRDLEDRSLFEHIRSFAQKMRTMHEHLGKAEKLYYVRQKQRWFLDAVDVYCDAVGGLIRDMPVANLSSRGFLEFQEYLQEFTQAGSFTSLFSETQRLKADLAGIRYCLHIEGPCITVSQYNQESDYGAEVLETFEKFKQGAVKEHRFKFPEAPDMNHVESVVLDLVAKRYPEIFLALEKFSESHHDYLDETIRRFDREVQFYIAYLEHIERLKQAGLQFCYPEVTDRSKEVFGKEVFDLALAGKLLGENTPVVDNDFHLNDPERILVVSGANQGGKTTFARLFGQLHYLAGIGLPVPGREARLFLYDRLFTHFEREEDLRNLASKLENDLRRIHSILEQATDKSILIMNESLSSTTLGDALFLNKHVMQQIIQRDMLCLCVTFLDELASLSKTTVSMVGMVDPDDPAIRTFKIIRRPADGLAHALAIARKYRLTYENVKERIAS